MQGMNIGLKRATGIERLDHVMGRTATSHRTDWHRYVCCWPQVAPPIHGCQGIKAAKEIHQPFNELAEEILHRWFAKSQLLE